ncbi:AAA family ATPase [Nibrella viscosa]|uniref:AAA family ATPase n=1 Tax=Nibrella viscosa TaxID=1084524 RepID=A0ABP8KUE2_9BACT
MVTYQNKKPKFRAENTVFYEAIEDSTQQKVFVQEIEDSYYSLDELVSLKNDYEITHDLPVTGVLKSLELVKMQHSIALVKEYFNGIPLSEFITDRRLPITDCLTIGIEMARVIEQIHAQQIIHKGINPANFIIDPDTLQLRLFNFSTATLLHKEQVEINRFERVKGSLFYISPEQTGRMNRSVDYRTDLYSLGVTLYHLFCGQLPFRYQQVTELVHAHLAKQPEELCILNPNIPYPLSAIVMKLLAKNAEDRYQSAKSLKSDLQQCLHLYQQTGAITAFVPGKDELSSTFSISEKLYGRRQEIQQLNDMLDKARNGSVELMLIAGYSGVGKTRLINEIHKPIAKENGYFTSGKFDQYNRNNPYSAIANAFGSLIRQFLTESPAEFTNWQKTVAAALDGDGQVLIDVIPELELLIGKQQSALKLGFSETQDRFFKLFTRFIQAIATEANPLVVFIDDLQWADSGSLELLYTLLTEPELRHVLLIGAYRDNEVTPITPSHPLMLMLERLSGIRKAVITLTLNELNKEEVNQLIADSLHREAESTYELTAQVMKKTGGNPFFINQFLLKLVQEDLIYFDSTIGTWQWNLGGISSMNITDNVVDLVVTKIQTLSSATQHVLKLASCIGNRFDLDTLSLISEKEKFRVTRLLWEAIKEELLTPVNQRSQHFNDQLWVELDVKDYSGNAVFKFSHDRIQQAAYSLIANNEKKITHLHIGRLLRRNLDPKKLNDTVFDVVVHFNSAADLITDREERIAVAQLNYIAAERAKNANSYQPALLYYRTGMAFISQADAPALYSDFLIARSECEYFCGNYAAAEETFDAAFSNAHDDLGKAEILARKMQLYENTSRHTEAIRTALKGLNLLGIHLPEKPGTISITVELLKVKYFLRNKSIDDLKDAPNLTSPKLILAMKILMNLWGPAYLHNQNLLALSILRMVNISARFGNSPPSALAYSFYGFVCCAQLNDIKNGYDYGKLGLWLNEKFDDKTLRSKVYVIYGGCIAHWHDNFNDTLDYLRKAHEVGIEANDLIYAGYALNFLTKNQFLGGEDLDTVYGSMKRCLHFGRQVYHLTTLHHLLVEARQICALMGIPEDPAVFMDSTNVSTHMEQLIAFAEKDGVPLPLTAHYIYQAELCYLFGEYEQALAYFEKGEKSIASMLGLVEEARLSFFLSLTLLALCRENKITQKEALGKVKAHQKRMRKWADNAKGNFKAKYLLVAAEEAAIRNQFANASHLFREAKAAAETSNIIQDIALINEQAGTFYKQQGLDEIGNSLLGEAIINYMHWGAKAKANQLKAKYPQKAVLTPTSLPSIADAFPITSTSSIDLQSIFKAATVISGEVVFEKLLEKLLRIVLENAGAETGIIILEKNGSLVAVAESSIELETVTHLDDIPVNRIENLPQSIVQFVYHTLETLIVSNAHNDMRFAKDPYLNAKKPKSILCQPILQHGNVIAIIYLENNLAVDVFTPARFEVLKLLSGQIAVSVQNALLYKKELELSRAYQRFVPVDFLSALGHQSILQVKLGDSIDKDMTVMFCDIRSFTSISERLTPKESFDLINEYLALVGPIVRNNNGFINHYLGDGFIALFKDNPVDALRATIEINNKLAIYNSGRINTNNYPLILGTGLHTGHISMGIIGDNERHDANVISDAVNISSRLEGLTKHFGVRTILSEETLSRIPDTYEFLFRFLGRVKVKGKEKVLVIYEMVNAEEAEIRKRKQQNLNTYQKGINAYYSKNFDEAILAFKQVLSQNPDDIPARLYLQRAERLIAMPLPSDWDGIEQMLEK